MSVYIEKFRHFFQAVKQHGGILGSLRQLYWTDELKAGKFVGEDKYGNKYYEDNMHFLGRNRWVQYTADVGMDYDGSQVPAEWHRWLHHITDEPPTVAPPVDHKWIAPHVENKSGTSGAFFPYSTTRPKIQSWEPPRPDEKRASS